MAAAAVAAWEGSLGAHGACPEGVAEQGSRASPSTPTPPPGPLPPPPWLPTVQVGHATWPPSHTPWLQSCPCPPPSYPFIGVPPHQAFFPFTPKANDLRLQSKENGPWVWGGGVKDGDPTKLTPPARHTSHLSPANYLCAPQPPTILLQLHGPQGSLLGLLAPGPVCPALSVCPSLSFLTSLG